MTTERWACLWLLPLAAGFAVYQFRAAEMNDDAQSAARERTTAWVAVLLAVMLLYGLIFDPTPRYPQCLPILFRGRFPRLADSSESFPPVLAMREGRANVVKLANEPLSLLWCKVLKDRSSEEVFRHFIEKRGRRIPSAAKPSSAA
jgi:hypothetical protein